MSVVGCWYICRCLLELPMIVDSKATAGGDGNGNGNDTCGGDDGLVGAVVAVGAGVMVGNCVFGIAVVDDDCWLSRRRLFGR